MKKWLLGPLLILATGLFAQAKGPGTLDFGMNLSAFLDYGAEYPTIDLMKAARPWFSHNISWVAEGKNAWDTGLAMHFSLDQNGWPTGPIPMTIPGTDGPQTLSVVWTNIPALGPGPFVCTWEGDGDLSFDMGAQEIQREPGRVLFVIPPKTEILRMTLTKNNPERPLRNIRVFAQAWSNQEGKWDPNWLRKLGPFHTLRFMDWGRTNNSPLKDWSERSRLDHYTWNTDAGAPYEAMIDLANSANKDLWVCIPHQASTDYIRSMARLFKANLKPGLKLYVEYSNEIWNWGFSQTSWLNDHGAQKVAWPERIVPYIQTALDTWSQEWKGSPNPLVRVVGAQTAWLDVSERIVRNLRPGSFDAIAGTYYLGFSKKSIASLEQAGAGATADLVWSLARADMNNVVFPDLKKLNDLATRYRSQLVLYEGGQHFTPEPFGTDQPYNSALELAQRGQGIYDLYREWFSLLKQLPSAKQPGGLVAIYFNLAGPLSGKYGSWGALESILARPPYLKSAPKYQALIDEQSGPGAATPKP